MTATLADGDAIVSAAQEKGLKIAVAHQGVYSPATQALKKVLAEGIIGDVQAIYTHGKQDARGGGEDMITLGTPHVQHDAFSCRRCRLDARAHHRQWA